MAKLYTIIPKVDTRVFNCAVGKLFTSVSEVITEPWSLVYSGNSVYVYKTDDKRYTAILATDKDNFIRYCDVKVLRFDGRYYSIYLYNGIFDSIRTYRDIMIERSIIRYIEEEHGITHPVPTLLDWKVACRNVYHANYTDQLSVPLCNNERAWRTVSDNDGEDCTDFIIIPDKWQDLWGTEDEYKIWDDIEEFIYYTVGYKSGYDFPTGKMITLRWGFHRVPCGVAVWHERGIDW